MSDFEYAHLVKDLVDYPKPGVVFKDITPLIADPEGFKAAVDALADRFKDAGITKVVGAEARGFIFGAPVAAALGAGFVPARKHGKLPREVISESYALEYGIDCIEMHADALCEDDVVLLVDDLVATGGTSVAQIKMVKSCGAKLAGLGYVLELEFLSPRDVISQVTDAPVFSLIKVQ